MTFFVISDIHGSSTALNKAIKIYQSGNYDKIIICGDILYHGARNPLPEGYAPKEIISILNELKNEIVCVRGNCESEVDSMVLEFPVSSDYSYYLNGKRDMFITHGHIYGQENLPPLKDGSILLSGHTHIPLAESRDGKYILNPGSISLPKGGFNPSYGILTDSLWEVRDLNSQETIISCNFV